MHKAGAEDYVVRSQNYYRMNRSVNVELDLDAGEYVVVVKVDAQRNEQIMPVEEVVRAHAKERREKLLRIGQAYDLAHAKGKIIETAEEKEAREAYEARRRKRERRRMAKFLQEEKAEDRRRAMRHKMREKRRKEKEEARAKARAEKKAARREARAKAEEEAEQAKNEEADSKAEDQTGEKEDGEGTETENESATVTADEKIEEAQDGDRQTRDADTPNEEQTEAKTPTGGKHVEVETSPDADQRGEGSTASTEPGEGAHTPTSSTVSSKQRIERGEEQVEETSQDDEAYVTAAEEVQKRDARLPPEKEPSTLKPTKSTTPPSTKSVDIGVQTGPGLPLSSPPLPSPPLHRGPPPPHYLQGMMRHPPPPLPPGAQFSRGPPGDLGHIPPHLRAAYVAHLQEEGQRRQRRPRQGPPVSEVELTDSSDSEIDENIDDLSDISEDEIDAFIAAETRARAAARAAAVAAKAQAGPQGGSSTPVPEEPLDEFEKDPWNAVGVFGLRVYYKMPEMPETGETKGKDKDDAKEEVVKLRVERPNYYEWDESSDEDEDDEEEADDEREEDGEDRKKKDKTEKKEESQVLDVDDSAKDAVGETPPTPGVELSNQLKGRDEKIEQEAGSTHEASGGDGGGEEGKDNNEDESKESDVFEDAESSHETGK